jgi:hypothetical protein
MKNPQSPGEITEVKRQTDPAVVKKEGNSFPFCGKILHTLLETKFTLLEKADLRGSESKRDYRR